MKRGRIINIAIWAGLIAFLALNLGACNSKKIDAINLPISDLEGNTASLDQYKGQVVFLNVWATWCGPCLKEMPNIKAAQEQLANQDVAFVLVSDEKIETIQRYVNSNDYNFDNYKLNESIKKRGIFSIPQTYILNKDGEVVQAITGPQEWEDAKWVNLLRELSAQ